jgi:uncharacterized damage-inducible protein DinB
MSASVQAGSTAQIAFADLATEHATTRKFLERIPEEQFAWKPHEKSYSLGTLAAHIANLTRWQNMVIELDEFDLATFPRDQVELTKAEILARFDENVPKVQAAVAALSDADLARPWTLKFGERVVDTSPKGTVLRSAGISHMIHHRTQLGVYLRLLNVPVPKSYGRTADEP